MLKKIIAAKTATVAGIAVFGVVAAGASTAVMSAGEDPTLDETTTTVAEETITTTLDETTTTLAEETTTTTLDETTTTLAEETTTTLAEETPGTTPPEELEFDRGPDPRGPAKAGLCIAFGSRAEGPGRSVAAANLRAAAAAAGQNTEEFCAEIIEPPAPSPDDADDEEPEEREERERTSAKADKGRNNGNGNGKGRGRN